MNDTEIQNALKSAFPTEATSEALRARVESLTPLAPVVTGYRFKFRHAFAAFAVLWIGHNVPVALRDVGMDSTSHQRTWKIVPNPARQAGAKGKDTRILSHEFWRKGNLSKSHYFGISGRNNESITFGRDHVSYTYYPKYYPKTHQVFVFNQRPRVTSPLSKLRNKFITMLPILLLRTHDNRPTEYQNGKKVKVWRIGSHTYYSDPSTEAIVQARFDNEISEIEVNIPIPDSLFAPDFPEDTNFIEQKKVHSTTTQEDFDSSWMLFKYKLQQYTSGQHP